MDLREWFDREVWSEVKITFKPLVEKKKALAFLVLLLVVALVLGRYIKALLFICVLTIVASLSMVYNLVIRLSLGFEFIMLATVLCSVAYGPIVGVAVGLVSLFFAEFISTKLTYNTFVSFIGITIIGFIASFNGGGNITMWGIFMTVLYDLIIIPGYLITGSHPIKCFIFVVTHIPWNIWVFSVLAPRVLESML